jgi:transcription antitermination factor NusG
MTVAEDKNPEALFPGDLLDKADPLGPKGCPWRIAHVKSRREKVLAGYLACRNIGYYLPMVRRRQPSAARARFSLVPLFPGYIFFTANDRGRHTALCSNQIARVIDVADPATLVDELRRIRHALFTGLPVLPADFLHAGQRVRVIKGPLKDLEGEILRTEKNCRLVLSVSSIMQSVSVQLDADMVESI